ncbi:MAG: LysE family transporter [Simkaniaceae bacterium]|nr:MAG: LysE family transporter [Simkaniaceae bacterium]
MFKGLCSGFFYTFISISGMILVAHYIMGKSAKVGFVASLGIVVAQFIYSLIASLIIYGFMTNVDMENPVYTLIGSAVLFIMAIKIYRSREKYDQKDKTSSNPLKAFAAGFLIALAVPIRVLGYAAIFTALKIHPQSTSTLFSPAIGVALGSLLWWIIYVISIKSTHKMISPKTLQQFHRYAALILIIFSLIGLSRLFL